MKQPVAPLVMRAMFCPMLKCWKMYALHESNPQKNDPEAIEQVKIAVTGGTLETTAPDSGQAVYSEDCTGFITGGTFNGKPPAAEFIVPGSGLQLDEEGNLVAVSAQLVPNADKVVNGVYVYDVASGKEITEADLLALMGMNVDVEKSGYTIKVNTASLAALNKAIAAADISADYSFEFRAEKDEDAALPSSGVDPLVLKVKLVDSSAIPEPVDKVTVTFETGTGSSFTQEVEPGSRLTRPADPTYDGWKFVGWFKAKASDGSVSGEWNFDKDVVTADMTLYGAG